MPRFDSSSDDLDILGYLHDVADAAADTLDQLGTWSLTGTREGQYTGDVAIDDVVVDMLVASGFAVLSEESGADHWDRGGDQLLVVVDPVDGSTNASKGLPWYATSLCVVDRDGPRVSLVAEQSGSEMRFSAVRGAGARFDGVPMHGGSVVDPTTAVVGVNGLPPDDHGWWQVRAMGAASLELCLVGSGGLDGYVTFDDYLGVWDYLGAMLVCAEAGVPMVDALGRDLLTFDPGHRRRPVAAGTPAFLDNLLEVARLV